jgi:hypothetical protein
MKKTKNPQNVIEVLGILFEEILAGAPIHTIQRTERDVIIAQLQSGPHDGWSLMVVGDCQNLKFFASHSGAYDPESPCILSIDTFFRSVGEYDARKGNLLEQCICSSERDLMKLTNPYTKVSPWLIRALELVESLPSVHIWKKEQEHAFKQFREKMVKAGIDCTPKIVSIGS